MQPKSTKNTALRNERSQLGPNNAKNMLLLFNEEEVSSEEMKESFILF